MSQITDYLIIVLLFVACSSGKGNESAKNKDADIPVMQTGGQEMPNQWIDKTTGHKIVKLTQRPGNNQSFYFHNNPFLPTKNGNGSLMVFHGTTDQRSQLFTVNLQSYQLDQVTHHLGHISGEIVGPKLREVFYQSDDSVFAANVDTHKEKLIYVFSKDFEAHIPHTLFTINIKSKKLTKNKT